MNVFLMHPDRDFNPPQTGAWDAASLTKDLELDTLWIAMAGEDGFLHGVVRDALFSGLHNDVDTILYRQAVLRDCLRNQDVVKYLYNLAVEAIEREKKEGFFGRGISHYPASILHSSISVLEMFAGMLRTLRDQARAHASRFDSEAFTRLFGMIETELDDDYLGRIDALLNELKFKDGLLLSAELDSGNRGSHYIVRRAGERPHWWERLFDPHSAYSFRLDPRDERGAQALSEIRDRGINEVANALGQSADHILGFFQALRKELAFYVGCLSLNERLAALPAQLCFPLPMQAGSRRQAFRGLFDVCLALQMGRTVVGNTVDAKGKSLIIITGANQGGKSSFLRGIGLAQLMMQSGMFVAAESFEAECCTGLFTHYKREEDASMKSGKLDEELARMSGIADRLVPNALLLFNESFAATNEREGSEIAGQVVRALLEKHVKVFFVTHFFQFSHDFFDRKADDVLFLRAERLADGTRTFRLVEGEPLATSHGQDLYRRIFGDDGEASDTPPLQRSSSGQSDGQGGSHA